MNTDRAVQDYRDMTAKADAIRSYGEFYEIHAELEQTLVHDAAVEPNREQREALMASAEMHHRAALALAWVIDNETRDPRPDGLPLVFNLQR